MNNIDNITVDLNELYKILGEFKRHGMDCVNISFLEPEEFDGEIIPLTAALSAFKKDSPSECFEEQIESIDVDAD